jgi:transcription elongation factor
MSTHSDDSKIASASIHIKAELKIPELVSYGVKWVLDNIKKDAKKTAHQTGDRTHATNTGDQSAATNTGYRSAATNTGYRSAATNTGDQSAATNTGDQSAATNTGDQSAATNTGYRSAATNTGDQSAATNTGDQSAAEVSGKSCIAIASGYYGRAKANEGSAIVLCRYDSDGNMTHVKSAIAGKDCKADVWYTLGETGELEEVA